MLVLNVSDTEVSLAPGGRVTIEVSITNTSTVVEHYVAEAVQLPDGVSMVPGSASCQLSPGKQGTVQVTIAARTAPPPRVGSTLIGIRVVSPHRLEVQRTEEVRLLVEARPELALSVTPTSVSGRRKAPVAVRIDNKGNAPLDVQVTATANEAGTTLVWKPGPVPTSPSGLPGNAVVLPGSGVTLDAEVRSRLRIFGRERRQRVELRAEARPVEGVSVNGQAAVDFTQPPVLPQGVVPRIAALGGAALVAGAMLLAAKIVANQLPGLKPDPPASQSPVAATQTVSPQASVSPTDPAGSPSPDASASPSGSPSATATVPAGATLIDFALPPQGKPRAPQEVAADAYPGVSLAGLPDASREECVTASTGLLWLLPKKGTDGYVAPGHYELVDEKPRAACQDVPLKITLAKGVPQVKLDLFALTDPKADVPLAAYQVTVVDANGQQPPVTVAKPPGDLVSATFADTSGKGILALIVQPVQSGRGVWVGVKSLTLF